MGYRTAECVSRFDIRSAYRRGNENYCESPQKMHPKTCSLPEEIYVDRHLNVAAVCRIMSFQNRVQGTNALAHKAAETRLKTRPSRGLAG